MKNNFEPKIVVMYRVKNEERWIEKSIKSILDFSSEIVILDDGSTDNTAEICSSFDKVVDIHNQSNAKLDEVRDKNFLLKMALQRKPDIIMAIDGDEILMPNAKNILFEELNVLYHDSKVFEFEFLFLWDKPNQIRVDGIFGHYWQKRLFRLKGQPARLQFKETPYPGNLHCGSLPTNTLGMEEPIRSSVKFLHCASLDKDLRQKKYEWYNKIDPNNNMTDEYKHMIGPYGRFSGLHGFEFKILPTGKFIDLN